MQLWRECGSRMLFVSLHCSATVEGWHQWQYEFRCLWRRRSGPVQVQFVSANGGRPTQFTVLHSIRRLCCFQKSRDGFRYVRKAFKKAPGVCVKSQEAFDSQPAYHLVEETRLHQPCFRCLVERHYYSHGPEFLVLENPGNISPVG